MSSWTRGAVWLVATLVAGCSVFIKGATPIGAVDEADREVVAPGLNEPAQISLKTAGKLNGIELAAGSVIKRSNDTTFRLVSAAPTQVGGVDVPAGSEIELVKASSLITGDSYRWNGVVHMGGPAKYGRFDVEKGDRVWFAGDLFHGTTIAQLQIASDRPVLGVAAQAGTIFDIDAEGKVTGQYSPAAQQQLAGQRAARQQRDQDCRSRCAIITDAAANNRCWARCMQ